MKNNVTYTAVIAGANRFTVLNAQTMSNVLTVTCNGDIIGSPTINQDVVTVTIRNSSNQNYVSTYRIPSGALICTIPVK